MLAEKELFVKNFQFVLLQVDEELNGISQDHENGEQLS